MSITIKDESGSVLRPWEVRAGMVVTNTHHQASDQSAVLVVGPQPQTSADEYREQAAQQLHHANALARERNEAYAALFAIAAYADKCLDGGKSRNAAIERIAEVALEVVGRHWLAEKPRWDDMEAVYRLYLQDTALVLDLPADKYADVRRRRALCERLLGQDGRSPNPEVSP